MVVAPSHVVGGHRVLAWPMTRLGRRAVLVAVGTVAWFLVLIALSVLDVPDWGWGARAALGISGLAAAVAAVSSGVAAVIGVVQGERSIALSLPLLLGVLWGAILIGEVVSTH